MANLNINFKSESLGFVVDVNVYLPDGVYEDIPTLWLLHGMYGDRNSWQNGSSICRYARKRGLAVVMPSVENSFYTNQKFGNNYYDYVAEELPKYLRSILPLSKKREKNYIAGLSMGGYGAFKIALRNPDGYCAAASLSGCLDIARTLGNASWNIIAVCNWGEDYVTSVKGTDEEIYHLVETFPQDAKKPRLFIACGTEDFLYNDNKRFHEYLKGKNFDFSYNEGAGAHSWDFWDEWIVPAIDFMMAK